MELNKIYSGDSLNFMPKIPNNYIDLIVTDPPFNIGKQYNSYKDKMKKEDYIKWCEKWITISNGEG